MNFEGLEEIDNISNCFHSGTAESILAAWEESRIKDGTDEDKLSLEELLKTGKYYCGHAAWDFYGKIWYEEGKFKEEVKQHNIVIVVIEADTLLELIQKVNDKFGWA